MKEKKFEITILWAVIEDYAGVWEILWEVNTVFPSHNNREVIKQILCELERKDFIKFYLCKEPYGEIRECCNWKEIIDSNQYWEAPLNGFESLRISATKSGELYYESLYRAASPDEKKTTGETD